MPYLSKEKLWYQWHQCIKTAQIFNLASIYRDFILSSFHHIFSAVTKNKIGDDAFSKGALLAHWCTGSSSHRDAQPMVPHGHFYHPQVWDLRWGIAPFTNNAHIKLPRTSAVWAHKTATWPPEERLLQSSIFKNYISVLACGNPKSGSFYFWKRTAPLTYYL